MKKLGHIPMFEEFFLKSRTIFISLLLHYKSLGLGFVRSGQFGYVVTISARKFWSKVECSWLNVMLGDWCSEGIFARVGGLRLEIITNNKIILGLWTYSKARKDSYFF